MAYYYYYQQHHTPSGSLSPGTMASELTPSLPPLLLLSPQQQQQQLTLPLVTPVLPSVTTSLPMTTTTAAIEFNQQQQLSTPKLSPFLRHCEETGLFQDLRNIGSISSSLTGPPGDTTTITVPVTASTTIVSTTSTELPSNSSLFGLSSSTILTHMPNPFDETFKQAVLQQQKCDSKLAENLFNENSDTNGDLNTPFISTTTIVNSTNNHNSTLTMAALPVDMITSAVIAAPITVESMTSNTSTIAQPQQQNLYMTTSTTESTTGSVLVMMMEQQQQQQLNSIVSIQSQNQLHHHSDEQHQQFIVPTTTNITSGIDTTITTHDEDYNNSKGDKRKNDKAILVENETTIIKQTLKQNLLVKRQMQGQQKCPLVLETHHNSVQPQLSNIDTDIATTEVATKNKKNGNNHVQEKNNQKQQLLQKHKQELLERNRSAAKRCRMKRKQRWELLSEENRRLKIENSRLRDILAKLISSGYGGQQQTTVLQVQQGQKKLSGAANQNVCIRKKNV